MPRRQKIALVALAGLLPGAMVGWFDFPAIFQTSNIGIDAAAMLAGAAMSAAAFGLVAFFVTSPREPW